MDLIALIDGKRAWISPGMGQTRHWLVAHSVEPNYIQYILNIMNMPNTKPAIIDFADNVGDFFDRIGLPRVAGRLFGYLLICDPSEQSAAQLQHAIGASAGSVNTMIRQLQAAGFVERRGEPGSRRLWYRIAPGAFGRALAARVRLVTELKDLAEAGLAAINPRSKRADRLLEMRDCYAFFEEEFPALVERYASLTGAPV